MSGGGLTKAAVKGTLWNYTAFASSKGVVFVSTVILARILAPADFGLLALGLLAINYLDTLSDFGVGAALIYRQDDPGKTADTAFILNLGTGILLAGLALFSAPWVAAFFDEPRVMPVIRALAFGFIISSLTNIHEARFKKKLDFRKRFIAEMSKTVCKGSVAISLALLGFGVWSLVWGQLAGWTAAGVAYWRLSHWRPRLKFNSGIARSLLGYGSQIVLVGLLGMIFRNVDYLIIGRRLDTEQLGFYTMAFRLPELIIINVCYIVGQALFPAYARLQHDKPALRRGFLTTLRYLSLIIVPAGAGMFLIAPEFVTLFYTEQWAAAIPVMQVLSLYAVIYGLSYNAGDVYKATGRPGLLNQIGVLKILVAVPVLWAAAGYNIYYVALGQLAINSLLTLLRLGIASRILAIRPSALLATLKPAVLGAIVMLTGGLALRAHILQVEPIPRLIILTLAGVLLYGVTLWLTSRELLRHTAALLQSSFRGKMADPIQRLT